MKKCLVSKLFIFIALSCNAQYFKNATYYKKIGGFELFYNYDSLCVKSFDSAQENYQLFENIERPTNFNAHLNIKIIDKKIYYQLANNSDSNFQLMFDLNAKTGDSFYIKRFEFYYYFRNGNPTSKFHAKIDSFLCKIIQIKDINYHGTIRKTWKTNLDFGTSYDFIDSVGFLKMGLTPLSYGTFELFYVCSNDSIIYQDSARYLDYYYCSKDSFTKYYSKINQIKNQNFWQLMPNPVHQFLTVRCDNLRELKAPILTILTSEGKLIEVNVISLNTAEFTISTANLTRGIYTLLINQDIPLRVIIE